MTMIVIALILILLGLLFLFRHLKIREMERENQMMQAYMMSLEELYGALQDRIEAARKYRHDLAKHIQTLEILLKQREKSTGMQAYMDELKGRYRQVRQEEYCRDEIVNAILLIKKRQCEERDIPVEFQIADVNYCDIQELDLVGLLHNLLDNAIEANERIPAGGRKGLFCMMERKGEQIRIRVENYLCPGEDVTFQTRKANKEEHGIGTKIIDNLVEKYNGKKEIMLDREQNRFGMVIDLKVEKREQEWKTL